jgi:DNA-directed RNA polymerase subunit RPC12/RpoP
LSSYFKDGKFSDFTIICDGKEYHVHRCFIAPQSKYFERAFTGMFKEGAERKIELKEDLVSMVDRMVHIFYNFNYDAYDVLQPVPAGKALSPGQKQPQPNSNFYALRIHVKMYCIADKYDIPALRTLALEKFKVACSVPKGSWSILAQATYEINKAKLPESDTLMRDAMVNAWLLSGCATEMVKSHPKAFASLMSAAPWLSLAIHARTLRNLLYSHVAKQASCAKCKTPAFFTQGDGFVKCKRCGSDLEIKAVKLMTFEVLIP